MRRNKRALVYVLMSGALINMFLFSLTSGSNEISFIGALKALFVSVDSNAAIIIKRIRFPRIMAACVTGAGLASSGCVFQAILKNPLADPFTLGVSAGAAFGATIAFVFGLASIAGFFIPMCAFAGAIISTLIVYLLSMSRNFDSNSMILSGVVVSFIFSSLITLMFALSPVNNVHVAFIWFTGNFLSFDERLLPFVSVVVIVGAVLLSLFGNVINAVSLGSEKSKTFGMNVEKNIKFLFLTASFITAATVSICGIIGFVGLMIPHIMRKIVGANNFILVPVSAFTGAVFLLFCDALSKILFAPVMIPVGVITSVTGGCFFIFLLFRADKI